MNIGSGGDIRGNGEAWFIRTHLPSSPLVIDAGAHNGLYAQSVIDLRPSARIFSLEPSPDCFKNLQARFTGNPAVQIRNFGLGSKTGSVPLIGERGSSLASVYRRRLEHFGISSDDEVDVDLKSLDEWMEEEAIQYVDLLKLDVEGHELEVFKGASESIANNRIARIQFEFGGSCIDARVFFQDFWYLLAKDFRIYRLLRRGLREIDRYRELHEIFLKTTFVGIRR